MARRYWYGYVAGDIFDEANYRLIPHQQITCVTGTTICAIYAYYGYLNPVIGTCMDSGLRLYITNSLISNVPQPAAFGAKKFLYKRN